MNTLDVIKYGHLTVLNDLDGLPEDDWDEGGVCGIWSTREIIAHLASYELLLEDVLQSMVTGAASSRLDHYLSVGSEFNDSEVESRRDRSVSETLGEYTAAYEAVTAIAPQVPAASWTQNGILPWYGDAYDLEDWVVYQFYGHKREHMAQINVYRDRIGR